MRILSRGGSPCGPMTSERDALGWTSTRMIRPSFVSLNHAGINAHHFPEGALTVPSLAPRSASYCEYKTLPSNP